MLFDVPFDRSQRVLPVPAFNNAGGRMPCGSMLWEAGFHEAFIGVVDWQTLIMGISCLVFEYAVSCNKDR